MKNKPLITVITVVYNLVKENREESFKQCVESVHNQSYKNIEHIIIDGASDDGTLEIIKGYANIGWLKYISEPDKSIYEAMNKGANIANGYYIAFLNSDDYYSDLKGVEKSIKQLVKTNADFSYAKCKILSDNKELLKHNILEDTRLSCVFIEMPFCHQSMIIKTDIFKNFGMYNLEYRSASDYEFLLKMILNRCTYTKCNSRLVTFKSGGFSTENWNLSVSEIADFYTKIYSSFSPLSLEEARNIYLYKSMPLSLIKKVLPYLTFPQKIDFLFYQFDKHKCFKRFKRNIIGFRYGKEKYIRILGKTFNLN